MKSHHLFNLFLLLSYLLLTPMVGAQSKGENKSFQTLLRLTKSFQALSDQVSPAVVQIVATGYVPHQGMVSGTSDLLTRQRSTGSGVILSSDGYIVTNAHVVVGARRIQVVLRSAGNEPTERRSILKSAGKPIGAQIVGVDRETDLAVLKIREQNLPFLELDDSDEVKQGQLVFAFGSPMGLENSVTMGVVSSVARQLRPEDPMIYIQTDASINPGNSGGPLVNTEGRVIGINTFIFTQSGGSEGLGFAAPSNIVRNVFDQIRKTGRVRRGEIGVYAQTVTPMLAAGLGLPRNWGVILGDVYPGSPAAKAGLKVGDLILVLDGKIMENGRQFNVNLYRRAIGEQVTLSVLRGADSLRITVPVIERPDDPERFADLVSPERNLIPDLGILAIEINEDIARMLPKLRKAEGLLVAARAADAAFLENGLLPGDLIYSVNGQRVKSLNGLRSALKLLNVYDPVILQIERRGTLMFVGFEKQ